MLNKLNSHYLLCLVTDTDMCGSISLEKVVSSAIRGGVNLVQLREKNRSTKEFLQIGRQLKDLLSYHDIPFIINDRVDVALALDADGVHLGQNDMPYSLARKILGKDKVIGLTVNNLEQAKIAEKYDVDYLGVGPVFPTLTKLDAGKIWDINELKNLVGFSRHRLIGIGGINQGNASKVIELGFDGVAVVSVICAAGDPQKNATEILDAIKTAKKKCLDKIT